MRFSLKLIPLLIMCGASPALAAQCQPPGGFNAWLEAFAQEAVASGISPRTVSATLTGLTPDQKVLSLDRNQKVFKQSFQQFAANRITAGRLRKGAALLKQHASLLARIEQRFGVPGPVIVAIWGLETDFGAVMGKQPAIRSLATLAHDCRRTEMFQGQLLDALRIVDRGDMTPAEMRGAWAGELGQTQFLPTSYIRFAVDFDGNGRRDLIRSTPDVLASTANYLRGYGWRPGQPWTEGTANFAVFQHWNRSQVYQKTIALFATKLAGGV
ncbi:lytic transglycosylase [Agaricicola taiwanensis]|uniref:Lytic transglycosylase n=2 Tax=Agaricicola taiwanensis TaxID=591372 RepID=A0A8J2VNC9_9RHOB|nr:lytic transglycosylase [Agaricicola taiwanensis]